MRKKVKVVLLLLILVVSAFIAIISISDDLHAVNKGHWLYDENGKHKGCESPGTDCTWSIDTSTP